jgi:hypothetical protein
MNTEAAFTKQIWIYWHDGWAKAPYLQHQCLNSWVRRNPAWKIHTLDAASLPEFIRLPDYVAPLQARSLSALSDVIRIHLLAEHGGVWADSTTWCARGLDDWLNGLLKPAGFFAYDRPAPDRPVASWFLAANAGHFIARTWRDAVDDFWRRNLPRLIAGGFDETLRFAQEDYFWFHRLFQECLEQNTAFAECWSLVPKISADGPHYLQAAGLLNPVTESVRQHIQDEAAYLYKLDSRLPLPANLEGTVLGAIFMGDA